MRWLASLTALSTLRMLLTCSFFASQLTDKCASEDAVEAAMAVGHIYIDVA